MPVVCVTVDKLDSLLLEGTVSEPIEVLVAVIGSTVLTSESLSATLVPSTEGMAVVVASAVMISLLGTWLSSFGAISRVVVGAAVTAPAVLAESGSESVVIGTVVGMGSPVSIVGADGVIKKPCSS